MKTSVDPRHQARRLALAELYALSVLDGQNTTDDLLKDISVESLEIRHFDKELEQKIVNGVIENKEKLIKRVEENSIGWELSKIFKVDLSILLIAIWEISNKTAPEKVIVDEAVELAKEFGSDDSQRFINGVLAGILKSN